MIVTSTALLTLEVVTGNGAVVLPGLTVTVAGTSATVVAELLSPTTAPAEGASSVRVTVPVGCIRPPTASLGAIPID